MGRRLIDLIVLAFAVSVGARMALAQEEAPASPPPAEALPAPADVPPPMEFTPTPPGAPGDAGSGLPLPAEAGNSGGDAPAPAPAAPAPGDELAPGLGNGAPGPMPAEGEMPAVPAKENPPPDAASPGDSAKGDPDVERSQAAPLGSPSGAGAEKNPLPPAKEVPGRSVSDSPNEADEFVLSPDRLRTGAQSVGLTVEVKGPPTLNLKTPATYKIIVHNSGTADADGVVVRSALPSGLEFISSQPTEQRGPDTLLVWHLGSIRAGGQQIIALKVKPIGRGRFDFAATVSMRAGAKSSTQVYEPKLRVVQTGSTKAKVLKGQSVESSITVSNIGDGVAKDVIVQAKLSPGLRVGQGAGQNLFEMPLGDLAPGEQRDLAPLVADAVIGGEQWCQVEAISPDVSPGAEESKSKQVVTVVEPKLAVTLVGPKKRYTDTIATYSLGVSNPGDATARNVRVAVTLPVNGELVALPTGAKFNSSTRKLIWDAFQLDPGEKEKANLNFEVRMGSPGPYQVTAQAAGEQGLSAYKMTSTDVLAMADLDVRITEERRVVDVGQFTVFTIRIKNKGSKAATAILVRGQHSPELVVKKTAGTEEPGSYSQKKPGAFVFPMIQKLEVDKEIELGIQVQALKVGLATTRIYVTHEEIEQPVEAMESLRVTQPAGQ